MKTTKKSKSHKAKNQPDITELEKAYEELVAEQQKTLTRDEAIFRLRDTERPRLQNFFNIPRYTKYTFRLIKFYVKAHAKWFIALAILLAALIFFFTLYAVAIPQSIKFSFTKQQNCSFSPVFFPGMYEYNDPSFNVSRPVVFSIGGVPIFSTKICASAKTNVTASTNYKASQQFVLLRTKLLSKTVHIDTQEYSSLASASLDESEQEPIAMLTPITFQLSQKDEVFDYVISAENKKSICEKQDLTISCILLPLDLSYEKTYTITLLRQFNEQPVDTLWQGDITTISAVKITESSIGNTSTVYNSPTELTLTTNKPLSSMQDVTLNYTADDGTTMLFPIDTSFKDTLITIKFNEPLLRRKTYELVIQNVTATDSSRFEQPFTLSFTASGGPTVTGVSIPTSGVTLSSNIVIYFDQALDATQDLNNTIALQVNGINQAISVGPNGNTAFINPSVNFPLCGEITISVNDSVKSTYGFSGDSIYNYSSRATCHTIYSIGNSVLGRPIIANQFGTAGKVILFIGTMHGNESNTKNLLDKWIVELDANPGSIPSGTSLVIIPITNPDGYANYSRLNANGVNLNRNFPTSDWTSTVTEPDGFLTNAGGSAPLSEPESAALANFVQTRDVHFAVTYHSYAGLVQSNTAYNAAAVGQQYAYKSDYYYVPAESIGNVFDYSISGAFEDWIGEKLNMPGLLVELETSWSDEFWRNKSAMWYIAQL